MKSIHTHTQMNIRDRLKKMIDYELEAREIVRNSPREMLIQYIAKIKQMNDDYVETNRMLRTKLDQYENPLDTMQVMYDMPIMKDDYSLRKMIGV